MKFKTLFLATLVFFSVSISFVTQAGERCPAGESGCTIDNGASKIQERVNEGARKVIQDENLGGRLEEVKSTIKDCVQCGADALKDGMDQVTGKGSQ